MVSRVLLSAVAKMLPEDVESGTEDSLEWFRTNIRDIKLRPDRLMSGLSAVSSSGLKQGKVYMFHYDAKWQEEIPYWDKYPIVIPLEQYKDGFLGINTHYIAPRHRTALLKPLLEELRGNTIEGDGDTRMEVDYNIIQYSNDLRFAKPCIKRYLTTHIGARIVEVPYQQWEAILMLPLAKFNVNANTVYAESQRKF